MPADRVDALVSEEPGTHEADASDKFAS